MQELYKDDMEGVVFTPEDHLDVRQWVIDRSPQSDVVATETRLYLPVYRSMTTVDPGDTIWFSPDSTSPNAFQVERA